MNENQILVRLEHKFQKTEDSTTASVDLTTLFTGLKINSAQEMNLQSTEVVNANGNVFLDFEFKF